MYKCSSLVTFKLAVDLPVRDFNLLVFGELTGWTSLFCLKNLEFSSSFGLCPVLTSMCSKCAKGRQYSMDRAHRLEGSLGGVSGIIW